MVDFRDLPAPLQVLVLFRNTVLYLFFLGVALAFLVEGTTLAREVGGVLLVICLVIGVRLVRKRFANPS